jgi:MFS family permease
MKDNSGTSLIQFGTLQKLLIFICGGGWMISNAVQVSLGILLDQIHEEWGISYILQSLVSIATMIGSFTGCFFWGILADRYGRRPMFTKVLLFIFLGLIIADFSPNIWMLAPCYIIVGFGLGGSYTVDGNVFLEYCPHNKQYLLTSLSALSSLGSCFPPALILIYKSLGTPYLWQLVQGTLGLIALLISIPRFWIKETPAFLLSKHKTTEVFELIHQMSPQQDKESLLQSILEASPLEKTEERPALVQLKCLFRKPFRKLTILYLAIWCGSSFTFTGVSSFLPVILRRAGFSSNGSGIYLTMLLQQLGKN